MPETLKPTIGVDGELANELEGAVEHFLPGRAAFGESKVLHEHQLGWGKAVVHLGERQLVARVGDPRLAVRVARRRFALGKVGVVVVRVDQAGAAASYERQTLDVYGLVGIAVSILGAHKDCGSSTVGYPRAVEYAQPTCQTRRGENRLTAHFLAELRPWVASPVEVV